MSVPVKIGMVMVLAIVGFLAGGYLTLGAPIGPPIGAIFGAVVGLVASRTPMGADTDPAAQPREPVKARDVIDWAIRVLLLAALVVYLADRVHLEMVRYQVQAELKKVTK